MSHATSNLIDCPQIQRDLDSLFTMCDPTLTLKNNETSAIRFLLSDVNAHGFELQKSLSPGNGKRRQVDLVYTPRILTSEMSSTPVKVCTSTRVAGMLSETYTIDDVGFQYDELFNLLELRDICRSNELHFAMRIQAIMNVALRKMDQDAINDWSVCIGNFADDEDNVVGQLKTVTTQNAAGDLDRRFISDVAFATENAGYCTVPFAFGWSEMWKTSKDIEAGCCATNSGVDIDKLASENPHVFMPNSNIEATFGDNHFLTMAAGATQFVYWNEFMGPEGINMINDDAHKQTILFEPNTGLPFDFQLTNNCGDISINMKLAYKVVCTPADAFSIGDRLEGVTQVNEYVISNP